MNEKQYLISESELKGFLTSRAYNPLNDGIDDVKDFLSSKPEAKTLNYKEVEKIINRLEEQIGDNQLDDKDKIKAITAICNLAIDNDLELVAKETTCSKTDCVNYLIHQEIRCSKGHKSCCKLLYISDDYIQKYDIYIKERKE
jgi:hypothetical protein